MPDESVDMRVLRREAQYPQLASMIMDGASRADLARHFEVSERTISDWINTQEFKALWRDTLLTSTNVFKEAAVQAIQDMVPDAIAQHRDLLTGQFTTDSVRWRSIQYVYEAAGVGQVQTDQREALRDFLRGNRVSITQIDQALILDGAVDPAFLDALRETLPPPEHETGDVIEGEYREA